MKLDTLREDILAVAELIVHHRRELVLHEAKFNELLAQGRKQSPEFKLRPVKDHPHNKTKKDVVDIAADNVLKLLEEGPKSIKEICKHKSITHRSDTVSAAVSKLITEDRIRPDPTSDQMMLVEPEPKKGAKPKKGRRRLVGEAYRVAKNNVWSAVQSSGPIYMTHLLKKVPHGAHTVARVLKALQAEKQLSQDDLGRWQA